MQHLNFDAAGRAFEKQPAAAASSCNVSPTHIENVTTLKSCQARDRESRELRTPQPSGPAALTLQYLRKLPPTPAAPSRPPSCVARWGEEAVLPLTQVGERSVWCARGHPLQ